MITIDMGDDRPIFLERLCDGTITITRNISGDGKRTRLAFDETTAQILCDHIFDLIESD
ncbi:hypothetical protein [Mycolicibacterium mageritense]|uniref:hypothetical protein n=1 Tax=Mycolicibacterium mageritense TaxID=53462 RepID=UPI00257331E2|nr:hypothetical protein [Mycolicibacterium mageritense]